MNYRANSNRYSEMVYRVCGRSGLKLPALSLGLWHNFGDTTPIEKQREILRTAFDLGITHFDLANNYGPLREAQSSISGDCCARTSRHIETNAHLRLPSSMARRCILAFLRIPPVKLVRWRNC